MIRLRNFYSLALAGLLLGYQANAQSNVNQFVRGGVTDASTLLGAYVAPAGESMGANLNAGWTNTATTLLPGRFEFKIVGNATYIPKKRRSYDLNALGLSTPQAVSETSTSEWQYANPQAPTVFGAGEENSTIRRVLTYQTSPGSTEQATLAEITLPTGLDLAINPISPALQFSIGVPLETEVMVRFLPGANTKLEETEVNYNGLWGVGLKHSVKQWVPGWEKLPFSLAIAAGYSQTKASIGFPVLLPEAPRGNEFADPNAANTGYEGPTIDEADYSNQGALLRVQAWNVNALISKDLVFFNFYGGLRYARSVTHFALTGTYGIADAPYYDTDAPFDDNNHKLTLLNVKDPVTISVPHGQAGLVGGVRFKMGFLSLTAEGTFSRYSTLSVGLSAGWTDRVATNPFGPRN